ncbi:MAG: preprotein translocase subunit SecE [Rubricoccaceae bacterium]|nr:preprotein translocase subunit SecE [Rubricoccaceae bacterium]
MATQTKPVSTDTVPGGKVGGYLADVNKEMRKVSWPARPELISNTVLTLVVSFITALAIFLADQSISWVLSLIYGG